MQQRPYPVPQSDPPRPARETLPTMYDLPSEDPEEPGLPDEFHDYQPQLLSRTLRLADWAENRMFTGADLNLYYDVQHPQWYKRPDWFLALGVPRMYDGVDLRSSYVVWQEGRNPTVVVELLSPGTAREDLGEGLGTVLEESDLEEDRLEDNLAKDRADKIPERLQSPGSSEATVSSAKEVGEGKNSKPPRKWEVYEQILRVPHYFVYSRYNQQLRYFKLDGAHYVEQQLRSQPPLAWIPELKIGLGIWQGIFEGVDWTWLRWCDEEGNWFLTDTEQAEQAEERAIAERDEVVNERDEALAALKQERSLRQALLKRLQDQGINTDDLDLPD